MNKIIRSVLSFSLKNKYFILFATVILLVSGIITFKTMPIEAFPDVTNTEVTVITQWPGRSAEEIEKFVTIPLEIALNPVQRKISLRSTSIFGLSYTVFVPLIWGICFYNTSLFVLYVLLSPLNRHIEYVWQLSVSS